MQFRSGINAASKEARLIKMSWICVGCSEQENDNNDVRGYGLCKPCQVKAKEEKAALFRKTGSRKFRKM